MVGQIACLRFFFIFFQNCKNCYEMLYFVPHCSSPCSSHFIPVHLLYILFEWFGMVWLNLAFHGPSMPFYAFLLDSCDTISTRWYLLLSQFTYVRILLLRGSKDVWNQFIRQNGTASVGFGVPWPKYAGFATVCADVFGIFWMYMDVQKMIGQTWRIYYDLYTIHYNSYHLGNLMRKLKQYETCWNSNLK